MSNLLESALLIRLKPVVEWGSAMPPGAALKSVDTEAPFDALVFQQRDRELAYRDLINAAAVVDASIEISSVWNAPAIRPALQGFTPSDLATASGDLATGLQDVGEVLHVTSVSVPADALTTDQSLATRDALIYEALAQACQVFADPPVVTAGSGVTPTAVWSLGEGAPAQADINTALPLDKRLFKLPDQNLADRDNQLAAYVANIAQVLRNPFEFANRLYVKVENSSGYTHADGQDLRELEVYTLMEPLFQAGAAYAAGSEVRYLGAYYRAKRSTSVVPSVSATQDWEGIDALTKRTWAAEPLLSDRNRIIYDKTFKTLQWMRESTMQIHVPQMIHALTVPGVLDYQRLTTEARIPEVKDALFWRRKAARIVHGDRAWVLVASQDSTAASGRTGTAQLDCASLLSPTDTEAQQRLRLRLGGPVTAGQRYRVTTLVRPCSTVEIAGGTTISQRTFSVTNAVASGGVAVLTLTAPLSVTDYAAALPRITGSQSLGSNYSGIHQLLASPNSLTSPYTVAFNSDAVAASAAVSGTVTCQIPPLANGGVDFTGAYLRSEPGRESVPMEWTVALPAGTWVVTVQYTNVTGATEGFGIKVMVAATTPIPLADDTVPWIFKDANGTALLNGTLVTSPEMQLRSDGTAQTLQLRWTYGDGALHVRSIKFVQVAAATSRYSLSARLVDPDDSYLSPFSQVSTHDSFGTDGVYERLAFEFDCATSSAAPCLGLSWLKTGSQSGSVFIPDSQIPLQVRKLALEQRVEVVATPGAYGFAGWRGEMLDRAAQCVTQAYAERAALFPNKVFTEDGIWTPAVFDEWLRFMEPASTRLRDYSGHPGALQLATPAHVGHPAIVPANLRLVAGKPTAGGTVASAWPIVTLLQPWMVEAGAYAFHADFWSPEAISS